MKEKPTQKNTKLEFQEILRKTTQTFFQKIFEYYI